MNTSEQFEEAKTLLGSNVSPSNFREQSTRRQVLQIVLQLRMVKICFIHYSCFEFFFMAEQQNISHNVKLPSFRALNYTPVVLTLLQ